MDGRGYSGLCLHMSSYIHQGGYVFAFVGLSVGEQITKKTAGLIFTEF